MATVPLKLAREKNISVREAERQLDTEAYLEELWQWTSSGLHQEYLCQMMFYHATTAGKSEHDCAICWGRQKPLAEWDMEREPTVMELVWPDSSQEDIEDLYHNVYQLWRLLGMVCCNEEIGSMYLPGDPGLLSKNASSVSGLLHCWGQNWDGAQLMSLGSTPKLNLMARYHATYDRFMGNMWNSCKEAWW